MHHNPQAGNVGYHKTLQSVTLDFYWEGMRGDIKKFVKECDVCQITKYETLHPIGLLQPQPILVQRWTNISMNFIKGLPLSHG